MTDHAVGDVVIAVVAHDPKPRPAVLVAWRGDCAVLAPLTSRRDHPTYDPTWVDCDPGCHLNPGHVWQHTMQHVPRHRIAPQRIGHARLEMADLILDVHAHWPLTIGEVEQFRWACE